jgi:hypothetical protein
MSDQTQQLSPEQRVRNLEQAAQIQIGMNQAIVQAVQELYELVKALTPEAADGETVQEPTALEMIRAMVREQMNGAGKVSFDLEQIKRWNQERKDNRG